MPADRTGPPPSSTSAPRAAADSSRSAPAIGAGRGDDRELAARLRRGDQGALAALYDRYAAVVLALLVRIVGSRAEAEDLLQEVFLQAWRRAPEYDPQRGSFSCWLFTIARNRALDVVRSPRHRSQKADLAQAPGAPEPAAPEHSPEDAAALGQRAQAVRGALSELSPVQREAIELAYYGGLSHSEIAMQTGEPLGTIKSRINQAATRLRAALGRLGGRRMTTYSGDFCARFRESLPLHALGVPLGEDAPALREHLEGCAACRRELDEHREALAELPLGLEPIAPPPALRARLLEQIETGQADAPLPVALPVRGRSGAPSSQTPRPHLDHPAQAQAQRRGPLLPLALAASLCGAAGLGALLAREHRMRLGGAEQLALLQAKVRDQAARAEGLTARLEEAEGQLRFLHARSVQLVPLTPPSEAQEGASGRILWDQDRRAWLFLAFRLPPPPPDRDYQLWFLVKDGDEGKGERRSPRPVSAGVARVLPTGELEISLTLPPDLGAGTAVQAAALTLEPKGGTEKPTTDPVLYGQI